MEKGNVNCYRTTVFDKILEFIEGIHRRQSSIIIHTSTGPMMKSEWPTDVYIRSIRLGSDCVRLSVVGKFGKPLTYDRHVDEKQVMVSQ